MKRKWLIYLSVFTVVAIVFVISNSFIDYAFSLGEKRLIPIYSVEREDKKIAISFDCAWGVEKTDEILNALDKFNVKCTFFAVKFWVDKYPDYVKKIVERGHEIGTHSATHPHMSKLSNEAIENELKTSVSSIEAITGQKVKLFRAPFGEYNNAVINKANELNLSVIQWDVDSLDWKDLSANEIAKRIINKVSSGSIILCHNNALHTAKALDEIFANLTGRGYEFVKISELIYYDNFYIDQTGKQIKNE